jgi:hypothetical protein
VKRSERLKQIGESNVSILNLVELWKEEEGRKQLLNLAEARKEILGEEVDKLSSIDEVKARMMGIDKNEIFNG